MSPAKKTMKRPEQNAELSPATIKRAVTEFVETKRMMDSYTQRFNTMKANLRAFVERNGTKDDKGHLWLDVGVEGASQLKIERRVSQSVDAAKAERWLKANGLWEQCSTVVPAHRELDEDALMALGFEKKIPKKVFDGFTVTSESFAFKTI